MRSAPLLSSFLLASLSMGCGDSRENELESGTAASESASATDATSDGEGETSSGAGSGASMTEGASSSETAGEPTTAGASSETADDTDSTTGDSSMETSDAGSDTAGTDSGSTGVGESTGAGESTGVTNDGVLDIVIRSVNDCTFIVEPGSITVPEGTDFTVNWVSSASSEVEFDVAKIDAFNQVPIIIGMEPGSSYHDEVREWCGPEFTGTFNFRLTSCFEPQYIPVDCGG